jgi:hypothetical protein
MPIKDNESAEERLQRRTGAAAGSGTRDGTASRDGRTLHQGYKVNKDGVS